MELTDRSGFTPSILNGTQNIHEIQAAATRSLERIQSIYEEIMSPSDIMLQDSNFEFETLLRTPLVSPAAKQLKKTRNKNSDHTYDELCTNCKEVISHCNYCKICVCGDEIDDSKSNSVQEDTHRSRNSQLRSSKETVKVTIPQPFALSHMDTARQVAVESKMFKLKEELESKIKKEMHTRVQSKPVPKNTHLPLYREMVKDSARRKSERKEKCLEVSNRNCQPVPQDLLSRPKSVSEIVMEKTKPFKATPVPKHILSSRISEKLKSKEEIRKITIAQRAEEILKAASSPFSQKPHRSHSTIDLCNIGEKNASKSSKRNIAAITDRLYIIKCKETMDDWNKKVLAFDHLHDENFSRKSPYTNFATKTKSSSLHSPSPFSFFPVRMSNATISRHQKIRKEILARERREDSRSDREEDLVRRRKEALRAILPRLKSLLPVFDSQREIEDKVKNFRATQSHRKQEYEKELEEIMLRVSNQLLLIERQSKITKQTAGESLGDRGGSTGEPDTESDDATTKTESDDGSEKDDTTRSETSENSES